MKNFALRLAVLLVVALNSNLAAAYIFGPPPVTELAESGENLDNISLFSREESFINTVSGSPTKFQSTGLAGVIKKGDPSGATNFMYRLAKTNIPTDSSYDESDFGLGIGGEWNMLSDRSLGVLANLQCDLGLISGGTSPTQYTGSTFVLGAEIGATYRLFIDKFTVAPFAMYNLYSNTTSYYYTSTAYSNFNAYRNGNSINLGVSVITGKFNFTFTQTTSTYKYSYDIYTYTGNVNTNGTMLTVGYNY